MTWSAANATARCIGGRTSKGSSSSGGPRGEIPFTPLAFRQPLAYPAKNPIHEIEHVAPIPAALQPLHAELGRLDRLILIRPHAHADVLARLPCLGDDGTNRFNDARMVWLTRQAQRPGEIVRPDDDGIESFQGDDGIQLAHRLRGFDLGTDKDLFVRKFEVVGAAGAAIVGGPPWAE